jgi:hypothetical protein
LDPASACADAQLQRRLRGLHPERADLASACCSGVYADPGSYASTDPSAYPGTDANLADFARNHAGTDADDAWHYTDPDAHYPVWPKHASPDADDAWFYAGSYAHCAVDSGDSGSYAYVAHHSWYHARTDAIAADAHYADADP